MTDQDWGYLSSRKWYYTADIKNKLFEFNCQYRSINRYKDDSKFEFGEWIDLENESTINDEVIEVECRKKASRRLQRPIYSSLFIQFIKNL